MSIMSKGHNHDSVVVSQIIKLIRDTHCPSNLEYLLPGMIVHTDLDTTIEADLNTDVVERRTSEHVDQLDEHIAAEFSVAHGAYLSHDPFTLWNPSRDGSASRRLHSTDRRQRRR